VHNPANNNAAPFTGIPGFGGGKLGIYSFWDTCNNQSPTTGINSPAAPNQYEFYNYSANGVMTANPQEIGNQFFNSGGGNSALGQAYYTDFFNLGNNSGINVQNELYMLNTQGNNGSAIQQVTAAMNTALNNYMAYLSCSGGNNSQMSGNNGWPSACGSCSNSNNPYSGGL
jgi:hypothetical protein